MEKGRVQSSAQISRKPSDADYAEIIEVRIKTLQALDVIALREEWRRLRGTSPPRLSRDLMLRAVAYALQIRAFGELADSTVKKLEASIGQVGEVIPPAEQPRRDFSAGARLVREWHGRTHSVEVLRQGFLFEGKVYRSLSEIARFITGSHWSGPRFFGLTKKRR
jgi:hypothetical protein